jgi:hypothetical protein
MTSDLKCHRIRATVGQRSPFWHEVPGLKAKRDTTRDTRGICVRGPRRALANAGRKWKAGRDAIGRNPFGRTVRAALVRGRQRGWILISANLSLQVGAP